MLVSLVQPQNAYSSIVLTLSGIINVPVFPAGEQISSVTDLLHSTPSTDLYFVFDGSTFMLVKLEQYLNASSPILATLSGMVMLVRLEQPQNALSPILLTLSGMVMLVRLEQPLNAP